MEFTADLHLHSKYSRATSPKMNVVELSAGAKKKGLHILGTGDFTHPKHLSDIKRDLTPVDNGIYKYNDIYFVLSSEISLMYSQGGRGRKVHIVTLAPDFEVVDQINEQLLKWGRLDYDGRPIFGRTAPEYVDLCTSISKDIEMIPAHIWTPWFGMLGSKSGFDSVEECFGERSKHIHALETGLSSDPAMNWRLSKLDKYCLISCSDSHSPYPWRLGREATVFEMEKPSYFEMLKQMKERKIKSTIEVDPCYGKYHIDGHRDCNVSMEPEESKKNRSICPVCKKPLTIGVLNRVGELADRPEGYKLEGAPPFKKLIPLHEIIAALLNTTVATKKVYLETDKLISAFGSELNVLLKAPEKALGEIVHGKIAEAIMKNRNGEVEIRPGYDGVYGVPLFGEEPLPEKPMPAAQKSLSEF